MAMPEVFRTIFPPKRVASFSENLKTSRTSGETACLWESWASDISDSFRVEEFSPKNSSRNPALALDNRRWRSNNGPPPFGDQGV